MKRSWSTKVLAVACLAFSAIGQWGCSTPPELKIELKPEWINEFQILFDPRCSNKQYRYFQESGNYPFDSEAKELNTVNVAWLAEASMLSYCDGESVNDTLKNKAGFEDVYFISQKDEGTQAFIASNHIKILVIFRGTEVKEFQDLVYDIQFIPAQEGSGTVHKGFRDGLDAVWEEVLERLHHIPGPRQRSVWFTGHSLGGAIAFIAAGRWKAAHPDQMVSLYTYGAPGVGDRDYLNAYPKDITVVRVIDNEDQVAATSSDSFDHLDRSVEVKYAPNSAPPLHRLLPAWLADHAPIYYAQNSWKLVMRE